MYFFIVNRRSGNGKGMKVWKHVHPVLHGRRISYRVEFTLNPVHAAKIVRQVVNERKARVLVVVGGDGTVQSVIHELIETGIPIGLIPAGSGNDFARGMGIPMNPRKALEYLLNGTAKKIDIARTGEKCCITAVGIGIDGKVAQTVNRSPYKKWFNFLRLGQLSYIISSLQVLPHYRKARTTVKVDEKEHQFADTWLIAAANFPTYGGGMKICPRASCTDGLFHICIVHGISRLGLLRLFPDVMRGKHIDHPAVTVLEGRNVKVTADVPMLVHGDGEIIGVTPIEVTLQAEAIHVIYNEMNNTV